MARTGLEPIRPRERLSTVRIRIPIAVALGLTTLLTLGVPGRASAAAPSISRTAHIAYASCPARQVVLTVTVPRRAFAPGQPVAYRVSLHNLSAQTCGPAGSPTQDTNPLTTLLGPCGAVPLAIEDARGVDVYPGSEAISCPALLGPSLGAHRTLTARGTWDQTQGGGRPARVATLVPRGTYHLVVAGRVRVPISLSSPMP